MIAVLNPVRLPDLILLVHALARWRDSSHPLDSKTEHFRVPPARGKGQARLNDIRRPERRLSFQPDDASDRALPGYWP